MIITFINRTNQPAETYRPLFEAIASSAETVLGLDRDLEISVTFVRSRTIHIINRDYRGIDRPTDVISFAVQDDDMPLVEEETKDLGDLFINIDYARRQAREYGHSEAREFGFLFTHGLLHCLGYDHMTAEEEKEMFSLQEKILDPLVSRA
ncbi:MAG: rRNA maturation RNase YbeY [Solobacterium sp.]|nr:rRNA maturation RNase YbeY [Solobacterium sp.]